jgi:hypothetical protein
VVVQPFEVPGNLQRYTIPDLSADAALTRFFTWQPDQIEFLAVKGHHTPFDYSDTDVIHRYVYQHDAGAGHYVPTEGRGSFRLNLWLYGSSAPARGEPVEVVITDFGFWEAVSNGSPEGESVPGVFPSLGAAAELWQAGWPSRPADGQARMPNRRPQIDAPVAESVWRDDARHVSQTLTRVGNGRKGLSVTASPDLRRLDDFDAYLTNIDSILSDVAEDIAGAWQPL